MAHDLAFALVLALALGVLFLAAGVAQTPCRPGTHEERVENWDMGPSTICAQ